MRKRLRGSNGGCQLKKTPDPFFFSEALLAFFVSHPLAVPESEMSLTEEKASILASQGRN